MQGASAAQRKKARLPKAILYSGLLFIAVYILALLSFQGALGLAGLMAPGIVDGEKTARWRRSPKRTGAPV